MDTITPIDTKRCCKCGRTLPVSEFHRKTASKDGLQDMCRSCKQDYRKEQAAKEAGLTGLSPEFAGIADRVLHERAKSILNELRARGWQVECSISYLYNKNL